MAEHTRGYYQILYLLAARCSLQVGCLGRWDLPAGYHVYTGSAARCLLSRVARHQRSSAVLRWHVDYLANVAAWVGTYLYPPEAAECALAAEVRSVYGGTVAVPRFGASDCRCPGHLAYFPRRPALPLPGGMLLEEDESLGRS